MIKHGLLRSWFDLYKLNKNLGHRNDIFRNIEDSFILWYGNFKKGDKVLDIGSGESTVPIFIRSVIGSSVYVIDIDIKTLDTQRKYCEMVNCSLNIEEQDATKLSYLDESFDKIVAVSSIEHIPEDGDVTSVKEFSRVLRPGGKCLITVPFGKYAEVDNPWYYAGFERRYDLENLHKRLISVSDLEEEILLFLSPPESGFVNEIYNKLGNIFDIYYKGNYHITDDDRSIGLTLGWIEVTEKPRESFGALICMKKVNP